MGKKNYLKRKITARFVVFLTVIMIVFWSIPCNFAFGEVQEGSELPDTPGREQSETNEGTAETAVETTDEVATEEATEETATDTTAETTTDETVETATEETEEVTTETTTGVVTEETAETATDTTDAEATLLPDTTPPVITIIGESPVMVELGSAYIDAGATAADDVDGDLTGFIKVVSTVDTTAPGSYKVTYNVSDRAGNAAAEVTRIVNVVGEPTVTTDKDDYSPGEIVVVTGSGWLPGETVKLDFAILPLQLTLTYYATADGEGNIYNDEYLIFEHHLGQTVILTATGQTTGLSAVTIFTDSPKIGSVTVGNQSPNTVYPTANATFTITIYRGSGSGSSGAFTANLSMLTALPSGCSASFSPSAVSFTSGNTSRTSTLTISTTSGSTPIGSASFTVKAEVSGTPADFATGSGTLTVGGVGSVTAGSQSPNPVYASGSATYAVTVNRGGGTGPFSADLSVTTSLPSGCTYSFSPSTVSFSSGENSKTSTLTVSTSSSTPAGSTSFTIRATNSSNPNDYKTRSRTLAVASYTDTPQIGSVTVGNQSPNTVYPTANARYTITITRGTGKGSFYADLSVTTPLPDGCTASFSSSHIYFSSSRNSATTTLTISTTSGSTPIGSASFTIKAENSAYSGDFATGSGTLTVGGVGSVTAGSQSPNPVYASGSATYAVTVNRGGGSGSFSVDLSVTTSLPSGCTASFNPSTVSFSSGENSKTSTLTVSTSSSTPAGSTSFTIRATNSSNPNDYKTRARTLAVATDTTLPTVSLTAYSPDPTGDNTPTYSGSAADTRTNIVEVEYRVDSGIWADVDVFTPGKNVSFTFTTPALTDGLHTIYARAYDAAGNVSATVSDTLTVTTGTPPAITGQPSSATKTVSESVTFFVTASGTAPLSYQWRKDGTNISGATNSTYTINSIIVANAGSYDVVVTNAYGSATSNTATLTVNKATPTITWANPTNIVYGTALSGTQLNATASVSGSFVYTPVAGTILNAGVGQNLRVDFTPTDTDNYNSTTKTVQINVTPKSITVTANSGQSKIYGDTDPVLTYTSSDPSVAFIGELSRVTGENIGTYAITQGTLSAGSNYTINFVSANLTITERAVTVTADPKSKIYGDTDPELTYQITSGSLVTGDDFSGELSRDAGEDVGDYQIQQGTVALNSNYTLTYVPANIVITPVALKVTADDASRMYGEENPPFSGNVTGIASGDNILATYTSTALTSSPVGTYPIIPVLSDPDSRLGNYTVVVINGTLTITPAPLTVTAGDASKVYGSPNPPFSVTYSGFKAGDDESDLNGSLRIKTPAGNSSPVGTYPITPSRLSSDNYSITFIDGTLTVTATPLTVTASDASRLYGNPNPAFNVTYLGFAAGDDESDLLGTLGITTTATEASPVGTYPITPSGLLSDNYNITFVDGTLTVTAVLPTVTAGNDSDGRSGGDTIVVNGETLDITADLTPDDEAEPNITVAGITSSGATEVSEFTRLSPIILISGFCIVAVGLIVLFIYVSRIMRFRKLTLFWLKMIR